MKRSNGWRMAGMAVFMTAMMAAAVHAQQPTVVLSIRGVDELLEDADFIGEQVNHPGIKALAEGQLDGMTQGKGLAGIDKDKPLGAYWSVTGGGPESTVIFLPVSDPAALKGLITNFVPDFKDAKGQWSFTVNGTKVLGKISGGYLFLSASPDSLAKLPDPAKLVNSKYDISLDLSLASIPEPLKQLFLSTTEDGAKRSLEEGPEPKNKAEAAGQELGLNGSLAVLTALVNEGDRLSLGIDVDSEKKLAAVDVSVTAKTGTGLSKSMATFGKITPMFSSLGADTAPLRLILSYPTTGMLAELDKVFDAIRETALEDIEKNEDLDTEDERKQAKGFAARIIDLAKATAKTGSLHSGLSIEPASEGKVRLLVATNVAKGDDANKVVDDVLKMLKGSPEIADVKIDAAKHAGARIHSFDPKRDEKAEELFGDQPYHMAVRNDSFWISAGGDNLAALKKAFDQSGKTSTRTVAPISLRMKPAALVVLMEKENEDLIERAKEVAGKPGDVANLEIIPIPSGAKLRMEFGTDLLQLAEQPE